MTTTRAGDPSGVALQVGDLLTEGDPVPPLVRGEPATARLGRFRIDRCVGRPVHRRRATCGPAVPSRAGRSRPAARPRTTRFLVSRRLLLPHQWPPASAKSWRRLRTRSRLLWTREGARSTRSGEFHRPSCIAHALWTWRCVIDVSRSASARSQHLRDEEGQLERLLVVQPRVARGLVAHRQGQLGDVARPAEAFGDVVTSELDMQPAGVGAECRGAPRRSRVPPR